MMIVYVYENTQINSLNYFKGLFELKRNTVGKMLSFKINIPKERYTFGSKQ